MERKEFAVGGKTATLYLSGMSGRPLVVFNNYSENGDAVVKALSEINCPEFDLLCVGNLNWDHDLSPWECPALTKNDPPFTGGADGYLELLINEILPTAKAQLREPPSHTCIAGYSLAGLFALYSMYRCDAFDRAASISGSLWFPGFREFVFENTMRRVPDKLYLSLGDKESKTKHPLLKTVGENTELIAKHYKNLGNDLSFELNPGNHFKDAEIRTAKGIMAIVSI